MKRLAATALILVLSGCLGATTHGASISLVTLTGYFAGPSLWHDPQNTPLPDWNWPTLSSPPNASVLPPFWQPIPAKPLPNPIKGLVHLAQSPSDIRKAGGIAIFGSLAVVPGYGGPSAIMDVSDPAHPTILSTFRPQEGMTDHRGAAIIAYPDGRLVTVISTSSGIDVWDISDPRNPQGLPPITIHSHKLGVVPGTAIIYNAPDGGGGLGTGATTQTATGKTSIFDLSDPLHAVKVEDFQNGFACHHIFFWNDPAHQKYRAICAGVQYAQLWDTKDPRHPTLIVSVPVPQSQPANGPSAGLEGVTPWAHYAGLNQDGTILLVGDEWLGGGLPPGCAVSANTPRGAASAPLGALWFFDVKDEKNPKTLGWYSALDDVRTHAGPETSCTAHHGRLVPDPQGHDVIAESFYGAGVVLVDFTGVNIPAGKLPHVIDSWADRSDTWETWYDQGYLFTGDEARGLDALTFR